MLNNYPYDVTKYTTNWHTTTLIIIGMDEHKPNVILFIKLHLEFKFVADMATQEHSSMSS